MSVTARSMTGVCAYCPAPIARWNRSGKCNAHKNKGKKRGHKPYDSETGVMRNTKHRAKQEGIPFSLTRDDVPPLPATCTSCGVALDRQGEWRRQPSLDRLLPHLGYVPGNVAWICRRCNQVKGNATLDELCQVVEYIRGRLPFALCS